ncbi:MAG: hypothetical protein IMF11_09805 [Proteobacteria bacterium]|nr:hypothetical protein [Pseudomonadota bacterium]
MTYDPIKTRQKGFTASERYTAELCRKSFLSLWSYPNIFRDQKLGGKGDGKEIADVIAVFGNDILLFSDKNCSFPSAKIDVSWRRWYKRAIHNSVKQLRGAERWLREYPNRVFLDSKCEQMLPIGIPSQEKARYHHIIVASGAGEACRNFFGEGSGSLMLCPDFPTPLDESPNRELAGTPFVIGSSYGANVHVLDDATLPIIMRELDTVSDFVDYLIRKSRFIENGHLSVSAGEEHLLAYYLTHVFAKGQSDFPNPPKGRKLGLDESLWPGLSSEEWFISFKKQLRPSYYWDKIIQLLSEDILNSKMIAGNENGIAGHERRVRALASAPRRIRLGRSLALIELIGNDDYPTRFRSIRHQYQPDTAYLFLVLKRDGLGEKDYRETRSKLMQAYVLSFSYHNPDVRHVIGFSTGPSSDGDDTSHEVVYLDRAEWSDEHERLALLGQNLFGIYQDVRKKSTWVE